jgi:hypothetical protein
MWPESQFLLGERSTGLYTRTSEKPKKYKVMKLNSLLTLLGIVVPL